MILKSITLNGFKSFGKKVTIDVTHNVTGVVGPNGSGKSNVAEAIRFVLGEQSMKSMRSKSTSDLIFKGSNGLSALNRASVDIKIDNSQKIISANISHDLAAYLDYDEIKLSREMYIDGESKYKINDATVRLRDVTELLALAGIGNSAHTLISQGEADRVLLASPRDRREILEDALGLRVYHLRIKDSEKKLEKVETHVREIEIIKREIRPQLLELGRSVKIIENRKEEINSLENYIKCYVYRETELINKRRIELDHTMGEGVDDRYININNKEDLQNKYKSIESLLNNDDKEHEIKLTLNQKQNEYDDININFNKIKSERDVLMRVQMDTHVGTATRDPHDDEVIKSPALLSFEKSVIEQNKIDIDHKLDNAVYNAVHNNQAGVISNIGDAKSILDNLLGIKSIKFNRENAQKEENKEKTIDYSDEIYALDISLRDFESQKIISLEVLANAKVELETHRTNKYEMMRESADLEKCIREIEYTHKLNEDERSRLENREHCVNLMISENVNIVGHTLLQNPSATLIDNSIPMDELLRKIERSKIKIESMGVVDTVNVMRQYEDLNERDQFLNKELEDLNKTESELRRLIQDLRMTLRVNFVKGIDKISFVFNNYFHEVFGGGRASLRLVGTTPNAVPTMLLVGGEGSECSEMVEELLIDVSLPEKKVKDLHMLSGGERSLVSIALIFAMSSIAPPPFIVLDETDAALDESNAKRYGKMLDKLAEKSKLLVITHNRATMNECDMLYGVTIGSDGASKILSIKFEK